MGVDAFTHLAFHEEQEKGGQAAPSRIFATIVSMEASPHSRPHVVVTGGGAAWTRAHKTGHDLSLGSCTPLGMVLTSRLTTARH